MIRLLIDVGVKGRGKSRGSSVCDDCYRSRYSPAIISGRAVDRNPIIQWNLNREGDVIRVNLSAGEWVDVILGAGLHI
jgi:hypothetical protein